MRAIEQLSEAALNVLCTVTTEAEAHAGRPAFWQWLRACAWREWARRHEPAKLAPEPGFPAMSAEELEYAAGELAAMINHEEQRPTDEASPALAAFLAEIGGSLALMRRHIPAASETRH